MLRRSGELRATDSIYELEYDLAGRLQRILVALTDITARKAAEAALQASEERLRHAHKMEAVGQLTGGIAHDFNNLLTTVMGSLEMLDRMPTLDARGKRLAGNALEGTRRAARLTSQLLAFSRRQRLAPEPLAPDEVVAGIADLLERSVGAQVTLNIPPAAAEQWNLLADRNQLEMALINLVLNARDAIEGTGTITVSAANRVLSGSEAETVAPEPIPAGDYVSITVSDTGHGMPRDCAGSRAGAVLHHQAGRRRRRPRPAADLRLRHPKRRRRHAAQHAGRRHVGGNPAAAHPGRGGAGAEAAAPAAAATRQGSTILFAEDDALLRETVTEALEHQGYTVIGAPNAQAALEILRQTPGIDLLFTDVIMPGALNGVGLALAARALLPSLHIIFASGYSDRQILAKWSETLDLIAKPYSLETLAGRIAMKLATAPAATR